MIYQKIYENSSKKRVSVLGEMILNIGYDLKGQFAWSIVTNSVMKKYYEAVERELMTEKSA